MRAHLLVLGCLLWTFPSHVRGEIVADFEDVSLPSGGFFNGPVADGTTSPGPYGGTQTQGFINSQGVRFSNRFEDVFQSWSGFAVSNHTDTSNPGFGNQFSSFAGSGASGSSQYAIASGYQNASVFDPTDTAQLRSLPTILLPAGFMPQSTWITNTTYTALSMLTGDNFAKQFGGVTGSEEDWLRLNVYGIDANDLVLSRTVELYLADYRFADSSDDYILNQWTQLDLTPLAGATSLHFNLASSDNGPWGMNTPAYFAMDNLSMTAVPEPSSFVLVGLGLAGIVWKRRAKRKTQV